MRTLSVLISSAMSLTMGSLVGKEVMFKLEQSIMDSLLCLKIQDDDHENYDMMTMMTTKKMILTMMRMLPVEGAAAPIGAGELFFWKRVRGERTN